MLIKKTTHTLLILAYYIRPNLNLFRDKKHVLLTSSIFALFDLFFFLIFVVSSAVYHNGKHESK